jgi:UDP-glucuronate 4-epimerase
MAACYSNLYGLNCTGLRFFTVYGPWGRPDMALFSFTEKILSGEELPLFNNGNMERDFTYIEDIIDGIAKAISNPQKNEVFNLGRGEKVLLKDFVIAIEEATGKKARIKKLPMQLGDVEKTFADTSKAKRILGYSPKTSIKEGVKRFVEWHKEDYKST